MKNVEAKFILQGYRSNGADAADATFRAAVEQARLDPVLGQWFAREQAFDQVMGAKLSQVQAPPGLRESILAGGRVTTPKVSRRTWWRQPAYLSMAAGLALLMAVGAAFWPRQAAANATFAEFALADARAGFLHHGIHGDKTQALQAVLSQPTSKLSEQLAVNFAALRDSGCRTVNFNGREVLEVCFERNGVWFHCYIAQRADFPTFAAALSPVLSTQQGASIASWADATRLYTVVSHAGQAALEKLL